MTCILMSLYGYFFESSSKTSGDTASAKESKDEQWFDFVDGDDDDDGAAGAELRESRALRRGGPADYSARGQPEPRHTTDPADAEGHPERCSCQPVDCPCSH